MNQRQLKGLPFFVVLGLFLFAALPAAVFGQEEQGTTTNPLPEETIASTTEETTASTTEQTVSTTASMTEVSVTEDPVVEEESVETKTIAEKIFAPIYTSRWFRRIEKVFSPDSRALHSCAAEFFTLDVSDANGLTARLLLAGADASIGDIEIGNPPDGFNVTFRRNNEYALRVLGSDVVVDMTVVRRADAQKGSFNVPIVYSKKNGASSVVCQLNIVNR